MLFSFWKALLLFPENLDLSLDQKKSLCFTYLIFFGLVGWHMGLVKDDMVWMDIYMMYMVFKCIALNEQWAF